MRKLHLKLSSSHLASSASTNNFCRNLTTKSDAGKVVEDGVDFYSSGILLSKNHKVLVYATQEAKAQIFQMKRALFNLSVMVHATHVVQTHSELVV